MTVETETISRTQLLKGNVTIGQLRQFVEVLPKTYETYVEDLKLTPPHERRFATINLEWHPKRDDNPAGWYIVTFTVFSDDWGEALLHGGIYDFKVLTQRRRRKCYQSFDGLAADMLHIFGEASSVRIAVAGECIARSREA